MQFIQHLECVECQRTYNTDGPMNLCPYDLRPVKMVVDVERMREHFVGEDWYRPDVRNMWRFGPLLPFDIKYEHEKICTLGEGYTPQIDIHDYELCRHLGLNVYVKDEGQPHAGFGRNPTGSFKDRGMAVVATMAKHYGLQKLAVPTQGNAGDSLCEYGHNHGLEVAVIMPDDTPMPIMGKVSAYSLRYPDTHLDLVKGTIREAAGLMKEKYLTQGFFNCATFQEPGWRIEGKKTMGLELAEPWPESKPYWGLPDAVFYPVGGGTGILGMWKAFDELEALGLIDHRRPKIIGVQSEANAPVVDAIDRGLADTVATDGGNTLATGINVPGGVGQKEVLRIIRASGGGAVAVSEQDIAWHSHELYRRYGLWISPEGAATVAALTRAKETELITERDTIVCFNTGSAEKYLPNVRHLFFGVEA